MPYNTYSKKLPRKINKHMIIYYRVSILINYMCTIYSYRRTNVNVRALLKLMQVKYYLSIQNDRYVKDQNSKLS